jgi:hypothetical protein
MLRTEFYAVSGAQTVAEAALDNPGCSLIIWLRGGGADYNFYGTLPTIRAAAEGVKYQKTLVSTYNRLGPEYDEWVEPRRHVADSFRKSIHLPS